ncbi:MAG TPA: S8 family serine peptidase [Symbiobacteriaceae bacterium]|nr:S8 family serine peptidase [Symbiobacteriaceae bacterium]
MESRSGFVSKGRTIAAMLSLLLLASSGVGTAAAPAAGGRPAMDKIHPSLVAASEKRPGDRVDVLVTLTPGSAEKFTAIPGAEVKAEHAFINTKKVSVPLQALPGLQHNPNVQWVSPDSQLRLNALSASELKTIYNQVANTPAAWSLGRTGQGVTVAVLDSGIGRTGDISGWYLKTNPNGSDPYDYFGHGTHVAGVINGVSARDYQGAAPGAKILSIKVSDDHGAGTASDLISGLEWVYNNGKSLNVRVVNVSVQAGTPESYMTSPVAAAVEKLWFAGYVVVVASGNQGAVPEAAWYPPSNDPYVISVGAVDDNGTISTADDTLAAFSSRGISQDGHYRPEIVAPGRRIVSVLAPGSSWVTTFPDRIVDTNYIRMSGTSFAAPVVAGAAAILLEDSPNLNPDQVKWALLNGARTYGGQPDSAKLVDVGAALALVKRGPIGYANRGLTPNNYNVRSTSSTFSNIYWDQIYWDQIYWDQIYWDQIYWDQSVVD